MQVKKAYLYSVTLITFVIMVVSAIMLADIGLKAAFKANEATVYPMACESNQAPGDNSVKTPNCDPALLKQQQDYQAKVNSLQQRRELAQTLSMLVISAPLFFIHWRLAKKEV